MGAGAGVYQRNVGALWDFYIPGTGWLVRGGRLQCDNRVAFPEDDEPHTADIATMDHNTDSDDTTSINYDSDPPYAEEYDGPMEDDHPMVIALLDEIHGPHPPHGAVDEEVRDGWVTPDENMSTSSASWEPITNTRGGLFMPYDDDWIPDFEIESE